MNSYNKQVYVGSSRFQEYMNTAVCVSIVYNYVSHNAISYPVYIYFINPLYALLIRFYFQTSQLTTEVNSIPDVIISSMDSVLRDVS